MNTTRRHPRTLEQAFGPYERGHIYEEVEPLPLCDKVILAISGSIAVGLLTCMLFGVI
jgi:hypothetical protein